MTPFPKPKPGMMIVGYRPRAGLPKDDAGFLLLDFEFGPIKRDKPPQIETRKLTRGARPRQGELL